MAAERWQDAIRTPHDFVGAKLALYLGEELLTYRRDRKAGIPFPGCWDLPGGGREGEETPFECAARELDEEFALILDRRQVVWARAYPSRSAPRSSSWFLVGRMAAGAAARIRFGDEGEEWRIVREADFLERPDAVPYLKARLSDYIAAADAGRAVRHAV